MKALSLWQPWALLIAIGAKRFETRSWDTPYRGPLVICASKKGLDRRTLNSFLSEEVFARALEPLRGSSPWSSPSDPVSAWDLPYGDALCVVDLVKCIRTIYMGLEVSPAEIHADAPFGDFSPGRYAWKLDNLRAFKEPFPVRGRQGLFDIDDRLVQEALCSR